LKGSAGTYGFDSVSLIAHRLEDYIETTRRLSSENLLDVQVIVDRIRKIFEGGDEVPNDRSTPILDSPPTRGVA
ncbi:MAG: Hpt domain-containing protein, partial [Pseudomonadota bacterium]|nr:Hpt domain-containing protein [Pseudomonadota bacterium]